MSDRISAKQFHDEPGTEGWHVLYGGAQTVFPTGSFAVGVELVRRIAEITDEVGREPDIDLRPEAVVVRTAMTPRGRVSLEDAALARRVSAIAAELGLAPDPSRLSTVQIAVAESAAGSTRDFWMTAFGYEDIEDTLIDPLRRGPRIWFDEIREPGRGRGHFDVAVPAQLAEQRVDAILAAGGRLARDDAPHWWVMASPENHGVDVAAWGDVSDS